MTDSLADPHLLHVPDPDTDGGPRDIVILGSTGSIGTQAIDVVLRNPDRFAWVLRGRFVGRGPDCEPLLAEPVPVARLGEQLLQEAEARYRRNFDAGHGSE